MLPLVFGLRNKPEVGSATFKRLGLDAMNLNPLQPSLAILAGPEGAGKLTVAEFLLDNRSLVSFINADYIERSLMRANPEAAPIEAGRLLLGQLYQALNNKSDVSFETAMSGKTWVSVIYKARRAGYEVTLCYVAVSSSYISLARAVSRVARGGHNIPPDTIHRRYARSLHNFFSLYSALVDNWYFFGNSATSALLLGCREGMTAEPRYLFQEEYEQFRSKALG